MADYYFKRGEQIYGPVDFPGLQLQLGAGNVSIEDLLSHDPSGPWLPFLSMLPAFAPETSTATAHGATSIATIASEPVAPASLATALAAPAPAPVEVLPTPAAAHAGSANPNRSLLWIITGLLSALLLITLFRGSGSDHWEYKVVNPKEVSFALELNALGADGWEVVSIRRLTDNPRLMSYEVVAKRRK